MRLRKCPTEDTNGSAHRRRLRRHRQDALLEAISSRDVETAREPLFRSRLGCLACRCPRRKVMIGSAAGGPSKRSPFLSCDARLSHRPHGPLLSTFSGIRASSTAGKRLQDELLPTPWFFVFTTTARNSKIRLLHRLSWCILDGFRSSLTSAYVDGRQHGVRRLDGQTRRWVRAACAATVRQPG